MNKGIITAALLLTSSLVNSATYIATYTAMVNDIREYSGPELDGVVKNGDIVTGSFTYSTEEYVLEAGNSGNQKFYYLSGNSNYIDATVNGYTFTSSNNFSGGPQEGEMMLYEGSSSDDIGAKNIVIEGYGDDGSFSIDPYGGRGTIALSMHNYNYPYPLSSFTALDNPEDILLAAGSGGGNATLSIYSVGGVSNESGFHFSAVLIGMNNIECTPTNFSCNHVSQVPIPAAVWLFGSALITLAGFKGKNGNHAF